MEHKITMSDGTTLRQQHGPVLGL